VVAVESISTLTGVDPASAVGCAAAWSLGFGTGFTRGRGRSAVVRDALRYAAAGWPVFPCQPGGKAPLGKLVPHGVLDATTDPDLIGWWWQQSPVANVAIATGSPAVDVVDFDVTGGRPGPASLARLRDAGLLAGSVATVRTPSGGLHAYFAGTEQGNGSLRRHGVDFRGRGGYVVAPASVVDGRPYELVAHRPATGKVVDWQAIRQLLEPPQNPRNPQNHRAGDHSGLVQWVAQLQPGGRNEGLYWAACRAVESGADAQTFADLVSAAVAVGLPEAEAARTVRSAQRTGVAR
jgi:hypothetical protein